MHVKSLWKSVWSKVEFFDPVTKYNLKSFGTIAKQVKVKLKNQEISVKANKSLFAKLIVMAQNRNFSMREVLSYSLGPLPWSIALADRYPDMSITNIEGNRRAAEGSLLVKITGGKQTRPQQWKSSLACGKKTTLPRLNFFLKSVPKILVLKLLPTEKCMLLLMTIATN